MLRYHYREIVDVTFPGATCSSVFSPAAVKGSHSLMTSAHLYFSFCTYASPRGSLTQPQPLRSSPRLCLGKWCPLWGCSSELLNTLHSGNVAGYATLCVCMCVWERVCVPLHQWRAGTSVTSAGHASWDSYRLTCRICAFQGISAMNYYLSFNPWPRWNKKHIPNYTVPLLWM